MIIRIQFCYEEDTAYMICPAKVGRNIRQLQKDFDRWLSNEENNHPYWVTHEDEEGNTFHGVCFDEEAFVYWLNKVRFTKRKCVAKLIESPNESFKKTIRF